MKKLVATVLCTFSLFCNITAMADTNSDDNDTQSSAFLPSSEQDPLESINRPIFNFNQGFDKYFMTPVAEGYNAVVPKPVRTGANNFFDNISMVSTTANDFLQGEFTQGILDAWRFVINSTFGLAGTIDVAQEFGLPKHFNDLGVTLAKWGDRNSTYLVIPFLGPTTVRDGVGLVGDYYMSPYPYMHYVASSNSVVQDDWFIYGLLTYRYLTIKAQLVDANKLMNAVALDPYTFARDAYYQYRNTKIGGTDTSQYLYLEDNPTADDKPGTAKEVAAANADNSNDNAGAGYIADNDTK